MNLGLEGRVAVITGGCGGIGRACANLLAAEGAVVVAADADQRRVDAFAAELPPDSTIDPCHLDVSDETSIQRVFNDIQRNRRKLDILVNAAGIIHHTAPEDIPIAEWEAVLRVNLIGLFLCCREAIRLMQGKTGGVIVNVASLAAQNPGRLASVHYAASKAAVANLTKTLARRYGRSGIRINTVNPGVIMTSMIAPHAPEVLAQYADTTPLGRLGKPEEVAAAVAFLVSDMASFVHGTHLDVNGGLFTD